MLRAHSPEASALIWSVSPPLGARAKLATTPFAQASALGSPMCPMRELISERLYMFDDDRMQTLPFHFGSARSS